MKTYRALLICAFTLALFPASAHADLENVEIQWAICEPSATGLLKKLGMKVEDESSYMISYFDSPDLALRANGVSARATQKTKGHKTKYKSKIKVEFQNTGDIDWDWLANYDSKCEYDQYGLVILPRCAVSNQPIKNGSLWSREQRNFLKKLKPAVSLDNLIQWGPYPGHEISVSLPNELSATITEVTVGRSRTSMMEFSIRVPVEEAASVHQNFSRFLHSRGILICEKQHGLFERLLELAISERH